MLPLIDACLGVFSLDGGARTQSINRLEEIIITYTPFSCPRLSMQSSKRSRLAWNPSKNVETHRINWLLSSFMVSILSHFLIPPSYVAGRDRKLKNKESYTGLDTDYFHGPLSLHG